MDSKSWKLKAKALKQEVYALSLAAKDSESSLVCKGICRLNHGLCSQPNRPHSRFYPRHRLR